MNAVLLLYLTVRTDQLPMKPVMETNNKLCLDFNSGAFFAKDITTLKPTFFGGGFGDGIDTEFSSPESFESGTPNTVGIIGLLSAIKNKPSYNITERDFFDCLIEIKKMNKCKVVFGNIEGYQSFLFSIVPYNIDISTLANRLYLDFNIECRHGLHCAFMAHEFYGNSKGALRFSFSPYTTKKDLDYLINSLGGHLHCMNHELLLSLK